MMIDRAESDRAKRSTSWKMSPRVVSRYWGTHAWAGIVTSLVIYVMFLLGSFVLFYQPLTVWEEPLKQEPARDVASWQRLADLGEPLPEQDIWIYAPQHERGLPKLGYFLPGTTAWRMWWLDDAAERVIPQREMAAAYVYDLHYLWHDVTGYWLQYGAGVMVFGFLLAIVTGVLIHLRKLVPQLHQFRIDRSRRVFWSDIHKVTGVFGLPQQLIYATTGALMALSPLLFKLSIQPVFGGDELRAVHTAGALVEEPPERDHGARVTPLTLDQLHARALAAEPRLEPEKLVLRGYKKHEGTVDFLGHVRGIAFGDGLVRVRARDGAILHVETPDRETAVGAVARWMHGLHTVEYGGLTARIMIFFLGMFGCITILSGNWVWLERRKARAASLGNTLLERLTAGVGGGAIVALGSLFLASRFIPLDWPSRPKQEELGLALVFFGCVAYALAGRSAVRTWWQLLATGSLIFAALPFAATRFSSRGLLGVGPRDEIVVGVELGFLLFAGALAAAAAVVRSARRQAVPATTPDSLVRESSAVSP
jgi:uncharacterized iron-regulated membrane protein